MNTRHLVNLTLVLVLVVLLPFAVLHQAGAADDPGSDLGISRCGTQTVIVRGSAAYRAYIAHATAAFCRAHKGVAPQALGPHDGTRCTGTPVGVYGSSAIESFIVQAAEGFCQQQIAQGTPAANAIDVEYLGGSGCANGNTPIGSVTYNHLTFPTGCNDPTATIPPTDYSFYMYTVSTSTAKSLGCNQGHFDAAHNSNSLVVLDYGAQARDGTGTQIYTGAYVTWADIAASADAFANGYYSCLGNDNYSLLYLAVGTNTSVGDVTYQGGQDWNNLIATIISNLGSGVGRQVVILGANDIEAETDWASPTSVNNWIAGWEAGNPNIKQYVDYGDAGGCPPVGTCNNGWQQSDVWYASWGAPGATALPEIYYSVNATQWTSLSTYAKQQHGGPLYFLGPLDQYDLDNSTNTATAAWQFFTQDLYNAQLPSNMGFSVEVHRSGS